MGFEPTVTLSATTAFEAAPFVRSGNLPQARLLMVPRTDQPAVVGGMRLVTDLGNRFLISATFGEEFSEKGRTFVSSNTDDGFHLVV